MLEAVGASKPWLQAYVNAKYRPVPQDLTFKKCYGSLILECDELASFVQKKRNKQWIWLAMDRKTREIVGFYVGGRSREDAQCFWNLLPPIYQQSATVYTDFWASYEQVIPFQRHRPVGKESGHTNHIERFNCALRQRVSRLVGAILYFIHDYNRTLRTCLA